MKWNELFSLRIAELVVKQLKQSTQITLHKEESFLMNHICQLIEADFDQEKKLDQEVNQMLEELEDQGHVFERRKMYPMLKNQLAKKKGIVL